MKLKITKDLFFLSEIFIVVRFFRIDRIFKHFFFFFFTNLKIIFFLRIFGNKIECWDII